MCSLFQGERLERNKEAQKTATCGGFFVLNIQITPQIFFAKDSSLRDYDHSN